MKILVVDDEKAIEPLFKQWFEEDIKEGSFDFKFAFSAEDAIEYLSQSDYADVVLILSDINMPGMNGIELLKWIKEKDSNLVVMIVTAYGNEYNYNLAMKYGADAFLEKPIDLKVLKENILEYKKRLKGKK